MINPWWPGWFRAAVVALVVLMTLTWFGLLRRRIGPWPLTIVALALLAALGVVMAAVVPGGSYLAALPAVAGGLGAAAALLRPGFAVQVLAGLVAGAVAVAILVPTVFLFFPALGLATGAAAALLSVMLALALLPTLDLLYPRGDGTHRLWNAGSALVAAVAALVFTGIGLRVDHFDANHPAPAELAYILDTDTGQARWVSTDAQPGDWVRQYLTETGDAADTFGLVHGPVSVGPAPVADLPAPQVSVVGDRTTGDRRTLTLRVASRRDARLLYLNMAGIPVVRATFQGRQVPPEELVGGLSVVFHAPPPDGLQVELELDSTGPAAVRVLDGSDGLDDLPGFTPRPVGVGIAGSHISEMAFVAGTYTL